jgi:hypothetical protein
VSEPTLNSGFQAAMSVLSHVYFASILGTLIRAGMPDLLDGERSTRQNWRSKRAFIHFPPPGRCVRWLRSECFAR